MPLATMPSRASSVGYVEWMRTRLRPPAEVLERDGLDRDDVRVAAELERLDRELVLADHVEDAVELVALPVGGRCGRSATSRPT